MADNLPPYCAVVKKSSSLNFLDPSGPTMACNESALPFRCSQVLALKNIPNISVAGLKSED